MKKNFKVLLALIIFLFVNLTFLVPSLTLAASDTSVVIQPSKIEVTASPDQKLARSFSVINRSNFDVTLMLVVKDYKQISEDGKLQFYNAATEPAASWIVPQYLQIKLKPLETKDVGVVISVPKDFSGGGHYGAILFQPVGNAGNIVTGNFGELILLTVTGSDIKTSAVVKTVNFWTSGLQQGNPVNFSFKMQNVGNTHFDTTGKLVLRDWQGKEIGNFNVGQLTVYPKTYRTFKWQWSGTPSIGIYKAEVMLSDPSTQKLKLVDGEWFIIFPWVATLIALFAGCLVFTAVKFRKSIAKWLIFRRIYEKMHNKSVLIKY